MILGRYGDTSGRPYVSGRLLLPDRGLKAYISFLVDTGADTSTLMPADATAMRVDFSKLTDKTQVEGIGGVTDSFKEWAVIMFYEPNRKLMRSYSLTIGLLPPEPKYMHMPSLLGRDVLDRWYVHYDPQASKLSFTVRSADHTQKV